MKNRVTPADIEAEIEHVEYVTHQSYAGQVLRWAVITMRNGYAVTGRPSCAVDPSNDDEAMGQKIALDNAKNEIWPLMGYELKSKMTDGSKCGEGVNAEQRI